jgi:hypothetical protein
VLYFFPQIDSLLAYEMLAEGDSDATRSWSFAPMLVVGDVPAIRRLRGENRSGAVEGESGDGFSGNG